MSELLTGDVSSRAQVGGSDFSRDPESFEAELDACLDRALASEPSEEEATVPESFATGPLRTLLDLASTEESWLQSLPQPSNDNVEPQLTLSAEAANVVIPEWLRAEASPSSAPQENACGAVTSWDAAPPPAWATPGSPAEAYAPQPWMPYAPVAPEPPSPAIADASTRILGMSPMSFVSAVAMGALAAGLLVVAGLRLTAKDEARTLAATAGIPQRAGIQAGAPGTQGVTAAAPATQNFATGQGAMPAQGFYGVPGTQPASPDFAQSIAGVVNTPALTDAQRAAQALTPNTPALAGPASAGLTTGLQTLAPEPVAPPQPAPVTKKKAPVVAQRAATLEAPEDTAEVREMSFGGEISEEEMARARQAAAEAEAEEAAQPESEIDEDFARELGFTNDAEGAEAAAPKQAQEKTVYIPPAPTSERENLTPGDITSVVVTNQPAIAACVQNFKTGTALENGGRFQMRWSVDTTGAVSGVAMETEALKGSPLAGCIEDQVRGWKFPVHRVAMNAPVRYPFVF
ncbi:AgmX/PglI C-terminal domain-containing protein [Corallococcus interemptor]|uniref:AgmX/PglI C-terminal domain-containing protein n=1 Tax=Corallococcus interemptor TaxID=2316720 RepID=UPI003D005E20